MQENKYPEYRMVRGQIVKNTWWLRFLEKYGKGGYVIVDPLPDPEEERKRNEREWSIIGRGFDMDEFMRSQGVYLTDDEY